ncbi:MAG: F0F1 ATP synthase subunit delta [Clostridium sp.]
MYEYLDRRYALALYKVADSKGKVEEYLKDLREIVALIESDEDFRTVIKHPRIGSGQKKQIFTKIFKYKIDDELLSFLLILIDKDRMLYLKEKLNQMEKIYLENKNTLRAEIITATTLNYGEKRNLIQKLKNKYNKDIILEETVDRKVIGGICIKINNDVIDGTIEHKLNEMKKIILD